MKIPRMMTRRNVSKQVSKVGLFPLMILMVCVAGAAMPAPGQAQESRLLLRLDPERSDGIWGGNTKGARLEEILQQSLVVDTGKARGPFPAVFVSVMIRGRRADDVFVSRPFEAEPGLLIESAGGAYPPQVPEELFVVGEPVSTSATEFPARRLEDYAVQVAMEAAQRARSPDGLFMVVVPAEPGARREILSSGLMIPMSERRH